MANHKSCYYTLLWYCFRRWKWHILKLNNCNLLSYCSSFLFWNLFKFESQKVKLGTFLNHSISVVLLNHFWWQTEMFSFSVDEFVLFIDVNESIIYKFISPTFSSYLLVTQSQSPIHLYQFSSLRKVNFKAMHLEGLFFLTSLLITAQASHYDIQTQG